MKNKYKHQTLNSSSGYAAAITETSEKTDGFANVMKNNTMLLESNIHLREIIIKENKLEPTSSLTFLDRK